MQLKFRFRLSTLVFCSFLASVLLCVWTLPWWIQVHAGCVLEEAYGFPLPALMRVGHIEFLDRNQYCCERCSGPFPVEKFNAYPELFKVADLRWKPVWPLLIVDLLACILLVLVVGWVLERRLSRHEGPGNLVRAAT